MFGNESLLCRNIIAHEQFLIGFPTGLQPRTLIVVELNDVRYFSVSLRCETSTNGHVNPTLKRNRPSVYVFAFAHDMPARVHTIVIG